MDEECKLHVACGLLQTPVSGQVVAAIQAVVVSCFCFASVAAAVVVVHAVVVPVLLLLLLSLLLLLLLLAVGFIQKVQ